MHEHLFITFDTKLTYISIFISHDIFIVFFVFNDQKKIIVKTKRIHVSLKIEEKKKKWSKLKRIIGKGEIN